MREASARRPRRIVARTLGLGISTLIAAGLLTWTPAATTGWSQGAAESTLWQLMNGARSNNGMAPVQQHGTLVSLARWRSSDMLAKDYFSHTIAGCGCLVYAYYDSNGLSYQWAGENIGWNSGRGDAESPVRVHEQFMASPGHRANVLDPRFTHGGVGAAAADGKMFQGYVQNTRMYTELFMQASGGRSGARSRAVVGRWRWWRGRWRRASSAPVAAAPRPKPKPKPSRVRMGAPSRPESSAGIDGVTVVVSAPPDGALLRQLRADELAAARATALVVNRPVACRPATATMASAQMEVSAPPAAEPGLLDGLVGAVLGFLFG